MLPATIETEEQLDDVMTRPSAALTAFVGTLRSPLVVSGASGKMGPSLAAMAKRAAERYAGLRMVAPSAGFTWQSIHGT